MKARLSAVQQAFLLLLLASCVLGVVARPYPANRRYMAALDEMTTFRAGYKPVELEKSLLDYARAQGAVPMVAVQAATNGRDVPALQVKSGAPPLQPTAAVQLRTLEDVRLRAQPDSKLTIGVPRADALGAALAWRLARSKEAGPWTLSSIELVPGPVGPSDVELERDIGQLRIDALNAQPAVAEASEKLDAAEQIFEARRKWKLPWKQLLKSNEARKAARSELEEKKRLLGETQRHYEQSVKRVQSSKRSAPPAQPSAAFAIARVALQHGGTPTSFDVPVALDLREAPVPSLRGSAFAATRAAGLWDAVKAGSADDALLTIRSHFNWHYRYRELLGIRLGGMTVLQFLPCLLPALLVLLVLRMREIRAGYNPFGTNIDDGLPLVGLKSRLLDCVVLVILPFAAAASAAASLLFIGQVPVLPVLTAVACLILGLYAFGKLGELQSLVEAMVQSHSSRPPADKKAE